jgi:hypothetical protein
MVRIIDFEEVAYNEKDAAHLWWDNTAMQCEHFFKAVSQFDPRQISADYVMKLQMSYITFERTPFPVTVNRARRILLDSMFAAITAASAALSGDDNQSRSSIHKAFSTLLNLKKELLTLGIQIA